MSIVKSYKNLKKWALAYIFLIEYLKFEQKQKRHQQLFRSNPKKQQSYFFSFKEESFFRRSKVYKPSECPSPQTKRTA